MPQLPAAFHVSDLLTIALLVGLEGLLSADNALVLAVLVLGLPQSQQRNALRYGMLGAFAFRTVATFLAVYLMRLGWVKLAGAAYLLYLVYRHFFGSTDGVSRRTPPGAEPWMGLNGFWATVVKVELTDIVFAVDSILVGVAMSPKRWVVVTGGILGIVMMRMVIGHLIALIERHPQLVDAAFIVIAWVGSRLILDYLHVEGYIAWGVPTWLSLGLIVIILVTAFLFARSADRRSGTSDAAKRLLQNGPSA